MTQPQNPTTYVKPVPIRPKSVQRQPTPDIEVDIMSPDDGNGDDMVAERDPESEEIVKQLEKGLPRWPGFGEEGWMEETPSVGFFFLRTYARLDLLWNDRIGFWNSYRPSRIIKTLCMLFCFAVSFEEVLTRCIAAASLHRHWKLSPKSLRYPTYHPRHPFHSKSSKYVIRFNR